jgi:hypothetical protein
VHGSFAYTLAYVFHAGNSADNTDTEMTRNWYVNSLLFTKVKEVFLSTEQEL